MEDKLKTPDWGKWKRKKVVTIFQAVYLSLDIEPPKNCNIVEHLAPGSFLFKKTNNPEYEERLQIALIALRLNENDDGFLEGLDAVLNDVHPDIAQVYLTVFAEWAESEGWDLPNDFPTDNLKIKRLSENEVRITFPYEVPILKAIAKVMHQYKEKKDTSEPLEQQDAETSLIEEMSRLKSSLPTRAAKDLATLIQPLDANKDLRKKPNIDRAKTTRTTKKAKEPMKKKRYLARTDR